MKISNSIFKTFFLSLCVIANTHFAYGQTASILPPAKTTFNDQNGKPLTSGTVDFYIPSTSTRKTTWQDAAETIPNSNPVVLDAAGRGLILGSGTYRQVVKDRLGNTIWDQVTASTGSGGGSTPTATGDGDLVGTIKPWAGMTAPNQYMFTYGQEISRTTYAALLTAITSTQAVFCNSGSPTLSGLSDTTNFWVGMTVEVSCVVSGIATVVSKTAVSVNLSVNANISTNTSAIFYPWGNGNSSTTFNLPDFRGFAIAGNNNMGGVASSILTTAYFGASNPNSSGAAGGAQFFNIGTSNLPAYTPSGTIASTIPVYTNTVCCGSTVTNSISLATSSNAVAGLFSPTTGGGSTLFTGTPQGGTATPISIIQPTKTTNYIIKVTPDLNSATASGVTSLGGMTGSIACAGGLVCTGNTITVNVGVTSVGGLTGIIACGTGITCSGGSISSSVSNSIYVLPSDYGITCDGVTDWHTQLQAMITASVGMIIFIPPGPACVTNTTLTLPSNTTITGGGREVSSIKGITDAANPIFSSTNATHVSLTNFWCQGSDSATTWTASRMGCYSFIQNSSAASTSAGITIKNMKLSGFKVNYWVYVNLTGSTPALNNFIFENNLIQSVSADIPTDASQPNNSSYALVMFSGTLGNGIFYNSSIKDNYIDANSLCFGMILFSNHQRPQITGNTIVSPGQTTSAHCTSGFGTINAYGISIYDLNSDGNPANNWLIANNTIYNPYASGIYINGDTATNASYKSEIIGNVIEGQTSSDDTLLPHAGISINGATDILVTGNTVLDGYGGIAVTSQVAGVVSVIGNHCRSGSSASGASCIRLAAATGTTNPTTYTIESNYLELDAAGTGTVIKASSTVTAQFSTVSISNNTINAAFNGLNFSNQYVSLVNIAGNRFGGVNAGTMFTVASLTGSLSIKDNVFGYNGVGMSFATLPAAINGSNVFVSDGAPASSPCTGTSTGSTAFRQNNAWKCF